MAVKIMNKKKLAAKSFLTILSIIVILLSSCSSLPNNPSLNTTPTQSSGAESASVSTPLPTRPSFAPGELVDYIAQTGDTLPALALRFNTNVDEILAANTFIPREATTMPPGMPIKMPIYYRALWGSTFQILPDHAFVNSPFRGIPAGVVEKLSGVRWRRMEIGSRACGLCRGQLQP
jgi:LysM repeat protein